MSEFKNVYECQSRNLKFLFSKIRAVETTNKEFAFYAMRLMKLIAEDGLALLGGQEKEITTPCGTWAGVDRDEDEACAVSIIRAGDSMLEAVRSLAPGIKVGKILIQRDEESEEKLPKMYYSKYPPNIESRKILLCDPMLATGGSAVMAIKSLLSVGVKEENIVFVNVIACPEGITRLNQEYPMLKIVTGIIDPKLNGDKYIVPGLGDYGDRFFGTC